MHGCWPKDDPIDGSAFHELVVLPTLAPNLSWPYPNLFHVPFALVKSLDHSSSFSKENSQIEDVWPTPSGMFLHISNFFFYLQMHFRDFNTKPHGKFAVIRYKYDWNSGGVIS